VPGVLQILALISPNERKLFFESWTIVRDSDFAAPFRRSEETVRHGCDFESFTNL
jgi:hypothetical protein